jgi:uncharacterized protein with GYD domain
VVLSQFTDQGIRTIKNSPQRASQAAELAKSFGCEMKEIYWTLGEYDIVTVIEAPDEQSFMSFGYALGSAGNIRTQTLRAFTKDECSSIIGKLPYHPATEQLAFRDAGLSHCQHADLMQRSNAR